MNKKCEGFDRIPVCMLLDAQPLVKLSRWKVAAHEINCTQMVITCLPSNLKKNFPRRDLNPGPDHESRTYTHSRPLGYGPACRWSSL